MEVFRFCTTIFSSNTCAPNEQVESIEIRFRTRSGRVILAVGNAHGFGAQKNIAASAATESRQMGIVAVALN
jgi:hypothetical protein